MRPTGIGYRSPREKTPAYYTIHVSILELKELELIQNIMMCRPIKGTKAYLVRPLSPNKDKQSKKRKPKRASVCAIVSTTSR